MGALENCVLVIVMSIFIQLAQAITNDNVKPKNFSRILVAPKNTLLFLRNVKPQCGSLCAHTHVLAFLFAFDFFRKSVRPSSGVSITLDDRARPHVVAIVRNASYFFY